MNHAFVVAARRTPVVRAGQQYAGIGAERLAAEVINALLSDSGLDGELVDQVILGNAAGPGGNIARVSVLASALSATVAATTVDAQCASGLEAIAAGARMIATGEADVVIAGGVESVSTAPWRMTKPGHRMEQPQVYSRARFTPAPDPDPEMGVAAENIAERFGITRQAQDEFALRSHRNALVAQQAGRFSREIVPVQTASGIVDQDTCPRPNLTAKKLAALRPAFVEDGTVTAGNSCPINDGAAAVLLVSQRIIDQLQPEFALRYMGTGNGACDPQILGMAAVPAFRRLERTLGAQQLAHPALVEFNEAFAVQALACFQELEIDRSTVNLDGGALALGHPYGASGAILLTRLFWQAQRLDLHGQRAIAMMAAAGGTGTAMALEGQKF